MKIRLNNEYFIKGLREKYSFELDNENKVKIKFDRLSDDDLIELVNRHFDDINSDWLVYKTNNNTVVIDTKNEKITNSIQRFRAAFYDTVI